MGVETLAAALAEQSETLEEVIEPYLIQKGLLQRTSRGRVLTDLARRSNLECAAFRAFRPMDVRNHGSHGRTASIHSLVPYCTQQRLHPYRPVFSGTSPLP